MALTGLAHGATNCGGFDGAGRVQLDVLQVHGTIQDLVQQDKRLAGRLLCTCLFQEREDHRPGQVTDPNLAELLTQMAVEHSLIVEQGTG
ncbi:hypothetical protein D3C78_1677810 [compost metagenome]